MKYIKLFEPFYSDRIKEITNEVMSNGQIASGQYISKFENGLSELLNLRNVISTADMTSSISLALHLSGVDAGDEVISSPYACMATNSPISTLGAIPIWVDVMPNSVFMDPEKLEKAITSKTKAVIVYHVAGYVGYINEISQICKKHNIKLIEDCNNSLLATVNDNYAGSFGDFSVYSLYPNRQINAFEGGVLVCKNDSDAFKAKKLRRFGIDYHTFRSQNGEINPHSDIPVAGWSIGLNNLCASAAFVQLGSLNQRITNVRANAEYLARKLSNIDMLTLISPLDNSKPVYWTFLILVKERNRVLELLKEKGIMASIMHYRNDKYSCFENNDDFELPNVASIQERIIALPCGYWLDKSDLDKIVEELNSILELINK